jgi:flagellar biosynthesis/type III secretory pathway protein FliH
MSSSDARPHGAAAFIPDAFAAFEAFDAFDAPSTGGTVAGGALSGGAAAWLPDALLELDELPPVHGALEAVLPDFGRAAPASHPRRARPAFVDDAPVPAGPSPAELAELARQEAEVAAFEAAVEARVAAALADAAAEADALREQACAEAWAQGEAAGRAACEAEVLEALGSAYGALVESATAVKAQEERWLANLEENVAALAVGVARHVIGREVASDARIVRALAAEAVAEFPLDHPLAVRVHPEDLAALRGALGATPHGGEFEGRELRWTGDAGIARGGVLVEGRERIVDGRVDAALERVYRALGRVAA